MKVKEMSEQIWTEKYRPTRLNEIIGNTQTINKLKLMVDSGSFNQHFLFAGYAGI